MALVRCENCGCPNGKGGNVYYGKPRLPVGHPDSGLICGSTGCKNPGIVWLLDWEETEYQKQKRIFELTGSIQHTKLVVR
jgi:hypothetical protein